MQDGFIVCHWKKMSVQHIWRAHWSPKLRLWYLKHTSLQHHSVRPPLGPLSCFGYKFSALLSLYGLCKVEMIFELLHRSQHENQGNPSNKIMGYLFFVAGYLKLSMPGSTQFLLSLAFPLICCIELQRAYQSLLPFGFVFFEAFLVHFRF